MEDYEVFAALVQTLFEMSEDPEQLIRGLREPFQGSAMNDPAFRFFDRTLCVLQEYGFDYNLTSDCPEFWEHVEAWQELNVASVAS